MAYARAKSKTSPSSASASKNNAKERGGIASSSASPVRGPGPLRMAGPTVRLGASGPGLQAGRVIQPKLKVNAPGDKYEREADRVAEAVMRMPSSLSQSQAGAAEAVLQKTTRQPTQGGPNKHTEAPAVVQQVLGSSGHPLDLKTRIDMETRFGQNFGNVRVHTDTKAAESAHMIGALAYTVGQDIVFDYGQYSPDTHSGRHLLAHELTHVVQQQGIQTRENQNILPVQRQSAPSTAQQERLTPLPDSVVDQVVQETLVQELIRYRNIPVRIVGAGITSTSGVILPGPVMKVVTVQATYFINTAGRRATYGPRRRANDFDRIVDALQDRGEISEIRTTRGGQLSSGRTVELGKATPDDIRIFIQEAVDQGIIHQYAITQGVLHRNQQLVDLNQGQLQNLIQSWVDHTGVGVDCSGFVLYASIRARERVRETAQAYNVLLESLPFDLPMQIDVPPELSHQIRSARSYRRGTQVTSPTDLRPSDAWVVSGGAHIRIVTRVEEVTLPGGGQAIEFDTAESSSAGARPGPVDKRWRTASLTNFDPIDFLSTGVPRGAIGGTFYRNL